MGGNWWACGLPSFLFAFDQWRSQRAAGTGRPRRRPRRNDRIDDRHRERKPTASSTGSTGSSSTGTGTTTGASSGTGGSGPTPDTLDDPTETVSSMTYSDYLKANGDDAPIERPLERERVERVRRMVEARSVVAGGVPHDHAAPRRERHRQGRELDAPPRHEDLPHHRRAGRDRDRSGELRGRRIQPHDHEPGRRAPRRAARGEPAPRRDAAERQIRHRRCATDGNVLARLARRRRPARAVRSQRRSRLARRADRRNTSKTRRRRSRTRRSAGKTS